MGESHSPYLLSGITVFTAESTLNDVKSQQSVYGNILITRPVSTYNFATQNKSGELHQPRVVNCSQVMCWLQIQYQSAFFLQRPQFTV